MKAITFFLAISIIGHPALIAQDFDVELPLPDFGEGVPNEQRLYYQALPIPLGANLAWRFSGDDLGTVRDLQSFEAVALQADGDAARIFQQARSSVPKGSIFISIGVAATLLGTIFLTGSAIETNTRVGGSMVSYSIGLGTTLAGVIFATNARILYRKSMDAYNEWLLDIDD